MTPQPAMTVVEKLSAARPAAQGNGSVVNIEQSERELRRQLARLSRWMHRLGFAPGTSGNLSVRLPYGERYGERCILATPTGCSKGLLRPSDMVIADMEGRLLSGSRNVTSEIGMHLAIYHARPDINAVVHAHPPIATGVASCGLALDAPLCAEIVMTLGKIPLAAYATTGTDEVADSLQPFVRDHDAILLSNHGLVTYGKDLLDAFMKTEVCEHFAKVFVTTQQLGCPKPLGPEAIAKLDLARIRYRANTGPAFTD